MKKIKRQIILFSVLLCVFVALGVFVLVWFFGTDYSAFEAIAREEAPIPASALKEGISPQGLCELPEESGYSFAMSGYLKGKPSRVYLFGKEGEPKYVTLRDGDKDVSTHFGGIACTGNYLVVASGKKLVRFSLGEALAAENGGAVAVKDSLAVDGFRSIAYCYAYGGMLYAGEFYRPGNYETDQSHHLTVAGGETNYGIVYAYSIDEEAEGGVKSATPEYALSVREQVQGIAVWEGGIALSTSYGLPDSTLWFYENPLGGEPQDELNGVPLYILDKNNLTATFRMPCMSEEIFFRDGRLYLLFESLSNKYKQFVRYQIGDVLSVAVADIAK